MKWAIGAALLVAALAWLAGLGGGGAAKPRRLLARSCGADTLELAEVLRDRHVRNHVSTDSFYFYWYVERWPALLWNGKVIASPPLAGAHEGEDPGLPVLPWQRAKLVTVPLRDQPAKGDWNVYLPPSQWKREEFDAIAACVGQHRQALQAAMDAPVKYWWSKASFAIEGRAKRLASVSWGDPPQTLTFTTTKPFSSPPEPGRKAFPEVLHIRPDGRWDIALGEFREMVTGRLVAAGGGRYRFEMTNGPNPDKPVMADPEYLAAWRSPDGRALSDFVPLAQ